MTQEQLRLEVQNTISNWVMEFLYQNKDSIPAYMVEDALNKVLLQVKEEVLAEFIRSVSTPPQSGSTEEGKEKESGE